MRSVVSPPQPQERAAAAGVGEGPAAAVHTSAILAGPRCRNCRSTEQACAYKYGQCCPTCSHWVGYDDNGNPRSSAVNPPLRPRYPRLVHRRLRRAWELVNIETARVTPTEAATLMAGATTGTSTKPAGPSWPFDLLDNKPTHCPRCGRRTPWRTDGTRIKHRTEADNPIAPYCAGGAA